MAEPYYSSTEWLLMGIITMVSVAMVYLSYYRAVRRIIVSEQRGAAGPSITPYYYVSVRSREAEEKAEAARAAMEGGDYAKAVAAARDAALALASSACSRLAGRPCGSLEEAAAEAAKRGYYQWRDELSELARVASKRSPGKGDASKALEIALRLMALAREIRVEPPKEAGAGKEGDKVPGGS